MGDERMTSPLHDFHIYVNIYINTKVAGVLHSFFLSFLEVLLSEREREREREVLL